LECIISLPDYLFFNTGITTYLWILSNNKKPHRKGKLQLINGFSKFKILKKKLGEKRKEITERNKEDILELYQNSEDNKYSKIYDNEFFGYTKVTIEKPLIKDGEVVRKKDGTPKPDSKLRDFELIPLQEGIEEYFEREVKPFQPNCWMDRSKDKVGYDLNFTKYFYEYKPLRNLKEITTDLLQLEKESEGIFKEIISEEV
jgi:type I restriction enzyme M protein